MEKKEYTAEDKANEEGLKLAYDWFKHTTTISTGSILLLVTFLEKLFQTPVWKSLIGWSLGSFILSVLCSLATMFFIAHSVQTFGEISGRKIIILAPAFVLSILSFIAGLVCLAVFAIKNFYV